MDRITTANFSFAIGRVFPLRRHSEDQPRLMVTESFVLHINPAVFRDGKNPAHRKSVER